MNILSLQPKEYLEDLIDLTSLQGHSVSFGYPPITSIKRILKNVDIVINCIDHDREARYICAKAKRLGKFVYLMQDGIFDFKNSTCNNLLRRKKIRLLSDDIYTDMFFTDRTAERYFSLFSARYKTYIPRRVLHGDAIKTMSPDTLEGQGKILISCANTPYFDHSEYLRMISLMKSVSISVRDLGYEIVYRIYDPVIINDLGISPKQNITSGNFEQALSDIKALICTPSSIVNTAAAYDIPVAILDYRSSPLLTVAGWRIHQSVDIHECINSMISRDVNCMDYQRRMLPEENSNSSIISEVASLKSPLAQSYSKLLFPGYTSRLIYKKSIQNQTIGRLIKKIKSIILTKNFRKT